MKLGIDYNYVERESSDFFSIKLLKGKWKDVIFTFGTVSIQEDVDNDNASLVFDFKVEDVSDTKFKKGVLEADEKFKTHIGDLLVSILEQKIEEDY